MPSSLRQFHCSSESCLLKKIHSQADSWQPGDWTTRDVSDIWALIYRLQVHVILDFAMKLASYHGWSYPWIVYSNKTTMSLIIYTMHSWISPKNSSTLTSTGRGSFDTTQHHGMKTKGPNNTKQNIFGHLQKASSKSILCNHKNLKTI